MRNLVDIIEDCKDNKKPDYEELRYAVLALAAIQSFDHRKLREVCMDEKPKSEMIRKMIAENSFSMYKTALNKSPKEYLGWNNDPENPEYQDFRKVGNKLLERAIKETEKSQ